MKHLTKKVLLVSLFSLALAGCNKTNPNDGSKASNNGGNNSVQNSTQTSNKTPDDTPSEVKLTGSYASPASLTYMNMRPNYNYYVTAFTFQTLDTYSDNTYCLTVSSTSYSGLVLPQEGNDATGSERENYVIRYFGDFSSKANELDETILDVKLSVPNRIIRNQDANTFVDTADFKPYSYTGAGNNVITYETAEDFLKAYAFKEITISVTTSTASFDYQTLENLDAGATVTASKKGESILTSYMSTGYLTYSNMRPTYNYYMTIMNQETLDLLDDTNYRFTIYSSDFSGLGLPEEGNDATGSDRANYRLSFYGTYTKKANSLDETMTDFSLSAPKRATLTYDAAYYIDTDNWDDAAKAATKVTDGQTGEEKVYATGAEYLATLNTQAQELSTTEETKSFDYLQFAAQLY